MPTQEMMVLKLFLLDVYAKKVLINLGLGQYTMKTVFAGGKNYKYIEKLNKLTVQK